jgi:hypothetical protein
VIDFGVARFYDGATLTQTGALVGTPMYMSPEQVAGRINVDHRSDIYSLGLVMYELLTLRRPIHAPTREAILRRVVTKPMIPVSWKNKAVPRCVVHKAIAKDPDERYQHATDLADDLQQYLHGQPVMADPYRYKFDEREIVAERPWTITATAFYFFAVTVFFTLIALPYELQKIHRNLPGMPRPAATPVDYTKFIVPYVGLALIAFVVGWRLLLGRAWARWLGIGIAVVSAGFALHWIGKQVVTPILETGLSLIYLEVISPALVPRVVIVVGGILVIFILLMHRTTKQWFQYSARLLCDHAQLVTAVKGGQGTHPARRKKSTTP